MMHLNSKRSYKKRRGSFAPWLGIFLGLFLAAFLLGGIYSASVFYRSVRDVVAHYNLPTVSITSVSPAGSLEKQSTPGPQEMQPGTTPDSQITVQPTPTPGKDERVNFLLLGLDQRPGERGPFRADTMMVVSLDRKNRIASMVSIPRDLWVPIPGHGENRINTAYFFGGPQLAKQTVQYNLGIPIHYYAVVNFQGFVQIVDALGGITIEVETPIYDTKYPNENYGYQTVYIPAGQQHMDGEIALKYARSRHGGWDFGRIQRQQEVLLAIRERALELSYRLVPKLPSLWDALGDAIDTDFELKEAMVLVPTALQIGDLRRGTIDASMTSPFTTSTGANVLWPNREKIGKLLEQVLATPTP